METLRGEAEMPPREIKGVSDEFLAGTSLSFEDGHEYPGRVFARQRLGGQRII